jgi:hypothetical protein
MNLRTFTLCALALLGGCQRESGAVPAPKTALHPKAPVAVQRGPTAQEQTAGMVEATTQGKSQAPVDLKFDLLQRPVQGQPLEIAIALLPGEAAGPVTVHVDGAAGPEVTSAASDLEFPSVEPAQVYRGSIKLIPPSEGLLLLTLTVNLKHEQFLDTRVFSVPLIVGAGAAAPSAPASSGQTPRASATPAG